MQTTFHEFFWSAHVHRLMFDELVNKNWKKYSSNENLFTNMAPIDTFPSRSPDFAPLSQSNFFVLQRIWTIHWSIAIILHESKFISSWLKNAYIVHINGLNCISPHRDAIVNIKCLLVWLKFYYRQNTKDISELSFAKVVINVIYIPLDAAQH